MGTSQKQIFLSGEGDAWFRRNQETVEAKAETDDVIVQAFRDLDYRPRTVLEVGCGLGQKLHLLHAAFRCVSCGIDPSREAIAYARTHYPDLSLVCGTAEKLPYEPFVFDVVFFAGCLVWCDRQDLFAIAAEADRVLAEHGYLVIADFQPNWPRRVAYEHHKGLFSWTMDYSRMWTWNPAYKEVWRRGRRSNQEDRSAIVVLHKCEALAYPEASRLYLQCPNPLM